MAVEEVRKSEVDDVQDEEALVDEPATGSSTENTFASKLADSLSGVLPHSMVARIRENANVVFWLNFYLLCSSTMLIINKGAVQALPHTALLLVLQTATSVGLLLYGRKLGHFDFENFNMEKGRKWIGVTLAWLLPMYTNMKALQHINVESVIVFRTLTTFAVAFGDRILFGKKFSNRAIFAMVVIVVGGVLYALNDVYFDSVGYFWAFCYFFATVVNALYIKYVFESLPHMGNWEKTYYNNLLALPVLLAMFLFGGDVVASVSAFSNISFGGLFVVLLSCVAGTAISLAGTMCRDLVSATSFNIAGNMNKFITVLLSIVVFGKVNTVSALSGLLVALCGGALYAFS